MKSVIPTTYQIKKALLAPHTLFMRWKYRESSAPVKAMMELHYYRPAVFNFLAATLKNENILYDADIDSNSVVVEVGASGGSWVRHMADRYDPVIYAVEPDPISFALLEEMAANNPKLQPLPYDLGEEDKTIDFKLPRSRSSVRDKSAEDSNRERATFDIAAIDRVWKDLKLSHVDLMKINIDGSEFSLLDKMIKANLLNKVDCFLIQFHEWHPGAYGKRRQIREELSKTHRLEWEYYFVWEKWTRI